MIASIISFGEQGNGILICDANCKKAWGCCHRPRIQLSLDEDDYVYLADSALGDAPDDPGDYEGGEGKPTAYDIPQLHIHNKWCHRACERSTTIFPGQERKGFAIPDMGCPAPNMHWRGQ